MPMQLVLLGTSLVIFEKIYNLNQPLILISAFVGYFLAQKKYKLLPLMALAIGHYLFVLSFSEWNIFLGKALSFFPYLIIYLIFIFCFSKLTRNLSRLIRLFLFLTLAATIVILQGLGAVNWLNATALLGLKLLVWPSALLLALEGSQLRDIKFFSFFYRLFPPWHVQLFHNVPTEPQDKWDQAPKVDVLVQLQKKGIQLLLICVGLSVVKLAIDQLVLIDWFKPYALLRLMWWRHYLSAEFAWYEKLLMLYFNFSYMLLNFTILGTLANACAKIWGFDFNLNVNFFMGSKVLTQWNLLFHYLNQIILNVFFNPISEKLRFVKNMKIRRSIAMVFSIYAFGFLYILFLSSDYILRPDMLASFLKQRAVYLGLICLLGLMRLWGPRTHRNKFLRVLAPYYYFLIFAPLLMFGMLSLDLNSVPLLE